MTREAPPAYWTGADRETSKCSPGLWPGVARHQDQRRPAWRPAPGRSPGLRILTVKHSSPKKKDATSRITQATVGLVSPQPAAAETAR
jgi:hypothetical protein